MQASDLHVANYVAKSLHGVYKIFNATNFTAQQIFFFLMFAVTIMFTCYLIKNFMVLVLILLI